MLARSALARLAAGVPKTSTHDLSRSTRLAQRRLFSRHALSPSSPACSRVYRAALLGSYRSYATAADATKATPKVKRDVKKAAAKKPTAKKSATKKPAKKKAAPKKKAVAKKKAKKELTPEQQEKQKEKKVKDKQKLLMSDYKTRALNPPCNPRFVSAWNVFVGEARHSNAKTSLQDIGAKFQALTPAEKEHYNHLANESNATRQAEFAAWIRSHTPEEIRIANNARTWLRRKLANNTHSRRQYFRLDDDRIGKQPTTPFALFVKERFASGDMKSISVQEAMKLAADEWKALSASEQQKYKDEFNAASAKYKAQFEQ